jgi:hypothetical protein
LNKLARECILWATFRSAYFDAFFLDPEAVKELKEVIFEGYPFMSTRFNGCALHMTTNYPGQGKPRELLGVSGDDWNTMGRTFRVQLHVTEFFVSHNMSIASVPIAAIDTPFVFSPQSKHRSIPDHLTLWGHPPSNAGPALIGLPLQHREPYMHVTITCIEHAFKDMLATLGSVRHTLVTANDSVRTLETQNSKMGTELSALREHSALSDAVLISALSPFAIRVQSIARSKVARRHVVRLRKSGMNNSEYTAHIVVLQRRWRDILCDRREEEDAYWSSVADGYY